MVKEILMAQTFAKFSFTFWGGCLGGPVDDTLYQTDRVPTTEAGSVFYRHCQRLAKEKKVLTYRPEWANGTGYYDGILYEKSIVNGEMYLSYDWGTNRLLIVQGSEHGHVCVHERYKSGAEGVFVKTTQNNLLTLMGIPTGAVGLSSMIHLLGDSWDGTGGIAKDIMELKQLLCE
jgi:hypothetical protein